jgi:hypothetical protein
MRKIMRATLHDHALNTYYGQWLEEKAAVSGPRTPAIAHDELASNARVGAFDVPQRDFPGNRSPPRWKNLCVGQKKKSARQETWRASSDDHAFIASI